MTDFSGTLDTFIRDLGEHATTLRSSLPLMSESLCTALRGGSKILVCGNGGSASDAQHIAAELVGGLTSHSRPALACISLTSDTAVLTALGNDYGYDSVFSRQVEALASPGDVLWLLSTSGRSTNLLRATDSAKQRGVFTVAMCPDDSDLGRAVDLCVATKASDPQMTQAVQRVCYHWVCEKVESAFMSQDVEWGNLDG